ncbi:NAD(P)H-dependent oxidoreductase [Streptomyces sp. BE20]|uniref:NADPH-dependent FMN reductase n=1 Tax=Streptomycetaceae TaxID=2062 RepID=UPI002E76700A|nr:NAD(P)H-dependent oxidoreductase [Streptomyces sp. BE20]MEE1825261.1 NAD(P)H-dependent oxidoreductase [Streptomyces sp. BE20]
MNLLLVTGTVAGTSSCHALTRLIGERAELTGQLTAGELDRSLLALPPLDADRYRSGELLREPAVDRLYKEVAAADAVVLATPVQHGSLSGVLKNLLDHLPDGSLADRPVLVAATATSLHNASGACDHLRTVVRALDGWAVPTHLVAQRSDLADPAARAALTARIDVAVAELARFASALGPAVR